MKDVLRQTYVHTYKKTPVSLYVHICIICFVWLASLVQGRAFEALSITALLSHVTSYLTDTIDYLLQILCCYVDQADKLPAALTSLTTVTLIAAPHTSFCLERIIAQMTSIDFIILYAYPTLLRLRLLKMFLNLCT